MVAKSKIEWTDATWNPIVGCTKVSAGCDNCYAIRQAHRMASNPAIPHYNGTTKIVNGKPNWTGKIGVSMKALAIPMRTRKPTRFFVNSMGDLFHPDVSDDMIVEVFAAMAKAQQHTFQILTKRADRMKAFMDTALVLPNVWLGVSIEDQETADKRIPLLLKTNAAKQFVSAEPLLVPVDMQKEYLQVNGKYPFPALENEHRTRWIHRIDWLIVGGESGSGARPMHPDWARSLRDQCQQAAVPFFFKQWGAWLPIYKPWERDDPGQCADNERHLNIAGGQGFHGQEVWRVQRVGKKIAGRLLDGVEHNGMPV